MSFATEVSKLTVNPVYAIVGDRIYMTVTASPVSDVQSAIVYLYNSSSNSTTTVYNLSVSGDLYTWTYTPGEVCDFRARAEFGLNSTDTKILTNVATFTTDIPAASFQSTSVYVPFITNSAENWTVPVRNLGAKPLVFTTASSPIGLSISPNSGTIQPNGISNVKITGATDLIPGTPHVFDAIFNSNDPRKNMSSRILAGIVTGSDGVVVSPVSVSNTKVSVGSDVNFGFDVFHSGVTLSYVYAVWSTPKGSKTFNYQVGADHFSSILNVSSAGTYTLSKIYVGYYYKGNASGLSVTPDLKVVASGSQNSMNLELLNGTSKVVVSVDSDSTPALKVTDGSVQNILTPLRSGDSWVATYTYAQTSGPVDIVASFPGSDLVMSKEFDRYETQGNTVVYFDGGYLRVPKNAFETTTVLAVLTEPVVSKDFYDGYTNFNQVSDVVSAVTAGPSATIMYTLFFNSNMVNGLFDNIKSYEYESGKWNVLGTSPTIENTTGVFTARTGTYALGLTASVIPSSSPQITSFTAVPNKLIGQGTVKFVLGVDKDCYYRLYIYDMRGRIVASQTGMAVRTMGNILYVLTPKSFSNGMYVAAVSVGPSSGVYTQTKSITFAIVK